MDLQDIGCKVLNRTDLSQDKNKWWAVVNAVMNFRIAKRKKKKGRILDS